MTDLHPQPKPIVPPTPAPAAPPPGRGWPRRTVATAALLAGLAIGAGVTGAALGGPTAIIVPLQPAPIAAMQPWSAVAVKGEVAEIFGGSFVLQDASGRTLVETGPEDAATVTTAETLTVQGRFDRGVVHAAAITHADGRTELLGPPGPGGPHGPLAWLDRHWHRWHRADAAAPSERHAPDAS